jgi:cell wall-associated NlpC family hydrolase
VASHLSEGTLAYGGGCQAGSAQARAKEKERIMGGYDIKQIASTWRYTPYRYGGGGPGGIDCSHFVWEVIKAAGHPQAPYVSTSHVPGSAYYSGVDVPAAGDIILWDGHMGIILDTTTGIFIGAQSGGVDEASYKNGYWAKRSHKFYRYSGP